MRIAMVSEHASPLAAIGGEDAGGQNVHVAELSAALGRMGHQVVVYTRRDDPDLPTRVRFAKNVEVVHVDAGPPRHVPKDELLPFMHDLAMGIADDWRRQPPDVVHGHFWMSGLAALEAAKVFAAAGTPVAVLQTFHALGVVKRRHQGVADTSPEEREWLEPSVARQVDRIIATCPDEVEELLGLGAERSRISVAPCGVDLEAFAAEGPAEDTPRRRFAVMGRLVRRKGVDLAIEALHELVDQGYDVELQIVGGPMSSQPLEDDPEAKRLRELSETLGISDRVVFRGQLPRDEIPAVLRSCTAVVCSPWYEPFGIVPLEAMACKVPVVVTKVGGLQNTVVDGVTGIHVPPKDPAALAEAMRRLLDDTDMVRTFGEAGRRRVEQGYGWDHVAALTDIAYRTAIADVRSVTGQDVVTGGKA